MCLRYFLAAAGCIPLCLCGLPVERERKPKIGIQPPNCAHSVKPQQAACKVDAVTLDVAYPAAEAAILEAHRGVFIGMERA